MVAVLLGGSRWDFRWKGISFAGIVPIDHRSALNI